MHVCSGIWTKKSLANRKVDWMPTFLFARDFFVHIPLQTCIGSSTRKNDVLLVSTWTTCGRSKAYEERISGCYRAINSRKRTTPRSGDGNSCHGSPGSLPQKLRRRREYSH